MVVREPHLHPNTKSSRPRVVLHRRRMMVCTKCSDLPDELFRRLHTRQARQLPARLRYIACSYTEKAGNSLSCRIVKEGRDPTFPKDSICRLIESKASAIWWCLTVCRRTNISAKNVATPLRLSNR